jgi:hypothetical protein
MDTRKALPHWIIPTVAVVGILTIGFAMWNGLFGYTAPVGHNIAVHPGMYDLRAEMQKPKDPNRQRLKDNPPSTDTASR